MITEYVEHHICCNIPHRILCSFFSCPSPRILCKAPDTEKQKNKKLPLEIASLNQEKQMTCEAGSVLLNVSAVFRTFLERVATSEHHPAHRKAESFTGKRRWTAGRAFTGCNFMLKWETVGRKAIWRRTSNLLWKSENCWISFYVGRGQDTKLSQQFENSGTKKKKRI